MLHKLFRQPRKQVFTPLLAVLVLGCSQAGEVAGTGDEPELPLPQNFQLHFNHRDAGRYRQPTNGDWRNGDNLEEELIEAIDTASEELLIAVQELTLPEISRALIRAMNRGVRVQVVLENNYSSPWSRQHPSDLRARGRRRQRHLQQLADTNRDGRLSSGERLEGDAIAY